MSANNDELKSQKEVAYYSALVSAWISSKMERDKTILSLSTGAIALLVTLMSTIGIQDIHEFCLYLLALSLFLISIILIVIILDKNSIYIEKVLRKEIKGDPKLKRLDKISSVSFFIAIFLTIAIGSISAYHSLNINRNNKMENNKKIIHQTDVKKIVNKSLEGLQNVSPQDFNDSFEGIENVSPQSSSETESNSSNENTSNDEEKS